MTTKRKGSALLGDDLATTEPAAPPATDPAAAITEGKAFARGPVRCFVCDQDFQGFPSMSRIRRCIPCGERDGKLTTDAWLQVVNAPDLLTAYREELRKRDAPRSPSNAERLVIPSLYRAATASVEVMAWADRLVAGVRTVLVLTGPTGVGKTYQACGALRSVCLRSATGVCRLVNAASLGRARAEDIAALMAVRALAIDDLGARMTPTALTNVYEIVNHRVQEGLPLIVTTNLAIKELFPIDERLASRLASGDVLVLDGDDRRVQR